VMIPMPQIDASTLLAGFIGGALSSIVTYFSTRSRIRLEMTVEYDKSLREKRLELYKQLWPKTQPLGRFAPHATYTYNAIASVSNDMNEWYFAEGGIYLSKRCRKPYFALKQRLQTVIEDSSLAVKPESPIGDETRRAIIDAAGRLRTTLSDDIRTRRAPWL
jgi:hypothetical protein